jgi:hypothetical protein
MQLARALLAGFGIIILASCSSPTEPTLRSSPTPATLSLQNGAWETIGEPQPFPLITLFGGLTFQFPYDGSIHYLYTASPLTAIRGTLTVTLRIDTLGTVVFNSLDQSNCGIPPSVRPLIWSNGNGNGDYDRWWSNPRSFALAAGTATISVPLTSDAWSSVNGRYGNADAATQFAFEKALLNVTRLGLTFGGGCSFGHGINLRNGNATFTLTEYSIR